jgi:hypothetical protein
MHNLTIWLFISGLAMLIASEIAKNILEHHRSHNDD